MKPMTLTSARSILSQIGCTLHKHDGEYRVSIKGHPRQEAVAYYTDDIVDAVDTGKAMIVSWKAECAEVTI